MGKELEKVGRGVEKLYLFDFSAPVLPRKGGNVRQIKTKPIFVKLVSNLNKIVSNTI